MKAALRPFFFIYLMTFSLLMIACAGVPKGAGSGSGSGGPFTISVTVSGLAGSGLVLQDNGKDNLTIAANGTFAFATTIASGVRTR